MAVVWSYIRFSTKKQLEGDSLRRQVEDGEAWVRRNNHKLAPTKLHDLGRSAHHARHLGPNGKLSLFLGMIEDGRVKPGDILLVENLDRLSRQAMNEARKVFETILEADVRIAVLRPYERIFTKESIADPFGLMEPLMAFHLAYLESKNKADRLRKLWDHKRTEAAAQGPTYKFDKKCPSWVTWDEKKKVFVKNDGAEAIRFIFEATAEGVGQRKVLEGLQQKFPPIGHSGSWNGAFVAAVLNNRAVLGERQPKTTVDGKRVPVGKAIPGYYPAVIDVALWDRAQLAKGNNRKKKGPNGQFVNLFTGIVFNANDGLAMHCQTTRAAREEGVYIQRRLVSYGHKSKLDGADGVSVAYFDLETAVLRHLAEIRVEDLGSKTGVSELRAKEQELQAQDKRLARIEADLATSTDDDEYQSLLNAARQVRVKKKELKEKVERLKMEMNADKPLVHAQDTLRLLADAKPEQRHVLRVRLRSLVAELVESIYLKPEKHFGRVWVLVQVNYLTGLVRQFGFGPGWETTGSKKTEGEAPACLAYGIDLRDKTKCQKPRLRKLAELLAKPAPAPVVTTIPKAVGPASELWLRVVKAQMAHQSFRVVPAKVRRFVDFVKADLECRKLGSDHWNLFVRWLKAEVADKNLEVSTARITFNRVREFLRWLFEQNATLHFDISGSAKKLIPDSKKKK